MDKLIIEFNKKFDKQKQELIDGFKALGEEKRLPKALATIEGEQPTYKNYFKAGWQSRQAEFDAMAEALLNQTQLLAKQKVEVEEKDKRIEAALFQMRQQALSLKEDCDGYKDPVGICQSEGVDWCVRFLEKALQGFQGDRS